MAELAHPPIVSASQSRSKVLIQLAGLAGRALALLVLIIGAVAFIFPLLWMLSTSLKDEAEVFALPPIWIPAVIHFSNYPESLTFFPFVPYLINTLTITVPSVVGNLIASALAAYGFSRVQWPGRDATFALVLATLLIPIWTTLIPVYVLFAKMHWVGTFLPLIVPNLFGTP